MTKEFDFVIYPLKLVITIGMHYDMLRDRYENMESGSEGDWGDEEDFKRNGSSVNLVKDKYDDGRYKILWMFQEKEQLTMRNVCHESFRIAMSVCQHCNMSLGFQIGQDEHAAYIAGFAGECVSEIFSLLDKQ